MRSLNCNLERVQQKLAARFAWPPARCRARTHPQVDIWREIMEIVHTACAARQAARGAHGLSGLAWSWWLWSRMCETGPVRRWARLGSAHLLSASELAPHDN